MLNINGMKGRATVKVASGTITIGYWHWNDSDLARLETAYLDAIGTLEAIEAKRKELEKSGKFTAAGIREQLQKWAADIVIPSLTRAKDTIAATLADADNKAAAIKPLGADKADAVTEMRLAEIRAWLRELKAEERTKLLRDPPPEIALAVVSQIPQLSGVAPATWERLREDALSAEHGPALAKVKTYREAAETTQRAVSAARQILMEELRLNSRDFDAWAGPLAAKHAANTPRLVWGKDVAGKDAVMVKMLSTAGTWGVRTATAEDMARYSFEDAA